MSPKTIKLLGTALAFISGAGAVLIPDPYRSGAVAIAGGLLGWLHLPQPGASK